MKSVVRGTLVAAIAAVGMIGCGDDGTTLVTENHCNPMASTHCSMAWPSGIFMVEDDSTATGWRLDIPEGGLPTSLDGFPIDPAPYNERDGFSASAPMLIAFPNSVDPSNLVHYLNYEDSLDKSSQTLLIDMDNGGLVAHFAEIDVPEPDPPSSQTLYIRPAARLQPGTRYAVGIRKTLKDRDGGELPIPEGYQSILDGNETTHPLLERVRPRYDDIFAAFDAEGIDPRTELVVAWDFVTASDVSMQSWMLAARDAAMPVMGDAGGNLSYAIEDDELSSDERIRRRIGGTLNVPLFLTQDGIFKPGTVLGRDAAGMPAMQGMYDIPFDAIIPECAYAALEPVPMLIYGHGLLGSSDQAAGRKDEADNLCMVVVGTDMRGMSEQDVPAVLFALNDLNKAEELFGGLIQGLVNHIALEHAIRGPMAQTLFVDDEDNSLVDPTKVYYYGLSQGHIFGSSFMAYDPFIERGVVGVGGANYSMMLERSLDWPTYKTTLIGAYPDALDVTFNINLMQMWWDYTDPTTTSPDFTGDGVPGTPPKQLLMHMAMGDDEVPNISTEFQARTMGIPLLGPAIYEVFEVPEVQGPIVGSALVQYDGGDRGPLTNEPPEDNSAHSLTRKQPATFRQMAHFYETGEIVVECNDGGTAAPCDCTQGWCE
jgi:hypothetical protein